MQECPHCHRRLISHASARCNWCGNVIDDPQYQAEATANREAYLTQQAIHDARRALMTGLTGPPYPGNPMLYGFDDPALYNLQAPFSSRNRLADAVLTQNAVEEAAQLAAIRARRMAPPPPSAPRHPDTDPSTSTDQCPESADAPPDANRFHRLEF